MIAGMVACNRVHRIRARHVSQDARHVDIDVSGFHDKVSRGLAMIVYMIDSNRVWWVSPVAVTGYVYHHHHLHHS